MDSWVINLFIGVAGIVSGYAVLRYKVAQLEIALKAHMESDEKIHTKEQIAFSKSIIDISHCSEKVIALQHDTENLLTLAKAEEKFVSKTELELHLKNIELQNRHILSTVDNMNKMIEVMMKKIETIVRRGD